MMPRNSAQTIYGSTGLFFGAVINANIFGELFIILSNLSLNEKRFETKIARVNTVMIDLGIPFEMQ